MDHDFWLQRWREGRTGFHQDRVMPLLEKHWDTLALPPGSRVFVPLAGKTLDMLWLAARGHRVLGVELSPLAVEQFFAENKLMPEVHASRYGTHYVAGEIELVCGDAFALDAAALADCAGVYDRAALIALPRDLRARYAGELYARLPADCRGLLITLEYPQHEKDGPPFSVEEAEVRRLYAPRWSVDLLERRDILAAEPGFAAEGVTALATAVYRLRHAGAFLGAA
ncbi:MAG: thiopurine S-methyltransferase [Rhodanobacteraceae bacterium]|jgi:thiopurine S-methyltransferase|nr:thiopurine S-methyltransferase [Rhodanobacteraceae bacterium]